MPTVKLHCTFHMDCKTNDAFYEGPYVSQPQNPGSFGYLALLACIPVGQWVRLNKLQDIASVCQVYFSSSLGNCAYDAGCCGE